MGTPDLGPDFDLAKRLSGLERKVAGLQTRDVLQNASIGAGGLTILDGGSLTVDGDATFNGSITLPSGSLNTGGSLSVGVNITAGGNVSAGGGVSATGALQGASLSITGGGAITGAGSVSTSGTVTAAEVDTTGDVTTTTGFFFSPAGYSYDITYTRHTAWLGNDGRLGWASSSITGKKILDTIPEPDVLRILDLIESHHYQRRPELAKRKEDPTYHVATEWGAVAEELHALGLWQVVVYEWDTVWDLEDVLDADGEPITNEEGLTLRRRVPGSERRVPGSEPRPIGIHYDLLGLLAIVGLRQYRAQARTEMEALLERLTLAGI